MGLTSNTGFYNPAAEKFGADDPVMVKLPRVKFQFKLEFVLNEDVFMEDTSFGRTFTFDRVESATMPDYDYGITPVNQYNRIRHIPTRMSIAPINVSFYDTKDNQFGTLLKAYANHYFHGHDLDPVNFSGYEILNNKFAVGDAHQFGAKSISSDSRFFFQEIRIYNMDTAQGGRITNLYNNMMLHVQGDSVDYSQSAPMSYKATFQPEHVNIGNFGSSDINATQAGKSNLQSSIAATVSNRSASQPGLQLTQRLYQGGVLAVGEALRNIDGQTFVVKN